MADDKKRGRPVKDETMESVSVRIDASLINSIDLIAENMSKKTGVIITRAQIIRKILIEHINDYREEMEAIDPKSASGGYVVISEKTKK